MRAILVADDDIDIPHLLEDLRRKLGIAACDSNDGIRMRAADAAHHLARFSVTDAGDRAGIDDIDIRVIALCRAVPVPDKRVRIASLSYWFTLQPSVMKDTVFFCDNFFCSMASIIA